MADGEATQADGAERLEVIQGGRGAGLFFLLLAAPLPLFLPALGEQRRVTTFLFGTRLTNVTRALAGHDADAALAAAGRAAEDWEGGTRIAECLAAFNRDWGRRVLTGGATVLLISDGLERGDPARLESEAERLQLSARRVIWLNPLLRYSGFVPRAAGIRALRAHVDEMRAGHSVASLEDLAAALAPEGAARRNASGHKD